MKSQVILQVVQWVQCLLMDLECQVAPVSREGGREGGRRGREGGRERDKMRYGRDEMMGWGEE